SVVSSELTRDFWSGSCSPGYPARPLVDSVFGSPSLAFAFVSFGPRPPVRLGARRSRGDPASEHQVTVVARHDLAGRDARLRLREEQRAAVEPGRERLAVRARLREYPSFGGTDERQVAQLHPIAQQRIARPDGDRRRRGCDVDDVAPLALRDACTAPL